MDNILKLYMVNGLINWMLDNKGHPKLLIDITKMKEDYDYLSNYMDKIGIDVSSSRINHLEIIKDGFQFKDFFTEALIFIPNIIIIGISDSVTKYGLRFNEIDSIEPGNKSSNETLVKSSKFISDSIIKTLTLNAKNP
jgi:stringent starvation protein B